MKDFSKKFPVFVSVILSVFVIAMLVINRNFPNDISRISNKMYRSINNGGIYITRKDGKNLSLLYKIAYSDFKDTEEKFSGGEFKNLQIKEKNNKRYLESDELNSQRLEIIDDDTIYDHISKVEYKYSKYDDFNKKDRNITLIYLFFENFSKN